MKTFTFTGPEEELRVLDARLLRDKQFQTDDPRLIALLSELTCIDSGKPKPEKK